MVPQPLKDVDLLQQFISEDDCICNVCVQFTGNTFYFNPATSWAPFIVPPMIHVYGEIGGRSPGASRGECTMWHLRKRVEDDLN